MALELLNSVTLILSLALLYGVVLRFVPDSPKVSAVLSGCLFGGICILGMQWPVTFQPGVIFDARTVILPLAGAFGGPLSGLISGAFAAVYRAWLGGDGATVGISVALMAMASGIAYHWFVARGRLKVNALSLFLLGTFVHSVEVLLFTFLPGRIMESMLSSIILPLLVLFIPATVFLGLIFQAIHEQVITKSELLKIRSGKALALEKVIDVLSSALESRDPLTYGHEKRVADIALRIGQMLEYDPHRLEGLHLAATVHDFGKIQIPTDILVKPSALMPEEYDLIKCHAEAGAKMLSGIEFEWPIQDIIRQHHERIDGSGYPRGLKGNEILEEARIIAVADTLEAMTSHRPFRPSLGLDAAKAELVTGRGTKYDARVVDACIHLLETHKLNL